MRTEIESSEEYPFRMERKGEDGHRHIFRTDSELEFIRRILQDLLDEFEIESPNLTLMELGEGWLRIEMTIDYERLFERLGDKAMGLGDTLHASIGGGKGWYECKDDGVEGEKRFWWLTRFKGGCYI